MRLWTLHPRYLDAKGLVALWREALLAQAVLRGRTRGYRQHPQLERFRACAAPAAAIATYLDAVHTEALRRGYAFDAARIGPGRLGTKLPATRGQLAYEWAHLSRKLRARSPEMLRALGHVAAPVAHPLFRLRAGGVASWEVTPDRPRRAGRPRSDPRVSRRAGERRRVARPRRRPGDRSRSQV